MNHKLMTCFLPALGLAAATFLLPSAARAEAQDRLTDLLLRKGVITKDEADQLEKEAGRRQPVTVGSGTLQLDGLLQIWYVHDPEAESRETFRLRRAEIKLSGEIMPKIRWTVMVDPAKDLKVTKTPASGLTAANGVAVDQQSRILQEVFVRIEPLPHHQIDVGQFKIPIAEEGRRSSSQLDTIERAIISRTFGDKRDIGIQATGTFPRLEYRIGLFNGEGINQSDQNDKKDYTGLLVLKPLPGLEMGGLWYQGHAGATAAQKDRYGAELRYTYQAASFKSEALWAQDGTPSGSVLSHGWYTQLGYVVLPERLQGVVKYEGFSPDQFAPDNRERDLTVGLNVFLKGHQAKGQLNVVHKHFEAARPEKDDTQLLAAVQVAF